MILILQLYPLSSKRSHLAVIIYALTILATIFLNFTTAAPAAESIAVCPLNLTQNLPCWCHVLSKHNAVQIICNSTQPDKIWGMLGAYSVKINKIAIRNCPEKTEILQSIPSLKIRSLEISDCSIGKIQTNAFDLLAGSLEELWLYGNELTSLPKLSKLKKLKSLNLNLNKLNEFPDSTLHGLRELTNLWLQGNQICSLNNPFSDQKNILKLLDLSQNCFAAVPASTLRGFMELTHLSLAGNTLKEINSMHFMNLPKLTELRLQKNELQRIQPNGFMNVPLLENLFLQHNSLSSFDPGTLQLFKNLQLVDLKANDFTQIPSFKDMAELLEVRLDDNHITSIGTLTFAANPKLKRISLAQNQISTIARNSFDSLDSLEIVDLSDNELTTIEKGMFEGMPNLKDLRLHNNSISELNRNSFASLSKLNFLDLNHNELRTIRAGTFSSLQRIHVLKLDNNQIETFVKGAFDAKVDVLLMDGNNLRCDEQLNWFVDWLVRNKVRTFVPNQPEIKCTLPPEKKGTRLKDLMIERNNATESLINSLNIPGFNREIPGLTREISQNNPTASNAGNILANLIPGINRQAQSTQLGTQVLHTFTESFPEIRNFPGMKFLPSSLPPGSQGGGGNTNGVGRTTDTAIDQFTQPLVKFASGMQPSQADVKQLLSSIPSLVVNVPGFGNVDVSKLNPSMVEYVMNGGQIPGIPRETLNHIVKQYMQRLYVAAAQAQGIKTTDVPPLASNANISRILRPVSELPHGLVQKVIDGNPLPHLTTEQTNVIKEYYTQHAPIGNLNNGEGDLPANLTNLLPRKVLQMMQLLPRNYNLSNLPPELVKQVMRGEMPDLTKLPPDLQQHIKDNFDRFASLENNPDFNLEEILQKLPKFEQPSMSTFSPYDIDDIDAELVTKSRKTEENTRFWRLCAAIALGLAGAITLSVLSAFCWYWRRTTPEEVVPSERSGRFNEIDRALPSIVREQSFRPSASSTLK